MLSPLIQRSSMFLIRTRTLQVQMNKVLVHHMRLNYSTLGFSNKTTNLLHPNCKNRLECKVPYSKDKLARMLSSSITSPVEYEHIAEETLQSITDRFEELLESSDLKEFDVNYSNDVLTVSLNSHGVYVINKQSPNKQIWLSSPVSGPKRYDYINGTWIYKHDGVSLHQLLSREMEDLLRKGSDFETCIYGRE